MSDQTTFPRGHYWIRPCDYETSDIVVGEWDGVSWFLPGLESPQETWPEVLSERLEPPHE